MEFAVLRKTLLSAVLTLLIFPAVLYAGDKHNTNVEHKIFHNICHSIPAMAKH